MSHHYPAAIDLVTAIRLLDGLAVPRIAETALVDLLQAVDGSGNREHLADYLGQAKGMVKGLLIGNLLTSVQADQVRSIYEDLGATKFHSWHKTSHAKGHASA